ncbi:MAG TPA: carboxypeptidase-like regulatory domain-containing protein, partial [Vicinamibacterales bacterium]|nr:carboxypeptidase-like regulatory domain-containing protein [Vicinamibacterales bacterium]
YRAAGSMIRRPLLSVLPGLLLAATAAAAQTPARDQPKPRAGTGVIRGRVVRADTGEPLRRAQVRVEDRTARDLSGTEVTMTDAQGRYELSPLPAGQYHLKASRGGFVDLEYGQRRPFERGRPVEVAEGAVLEKIDFALPPGGVVTGRVVDEIGEPFPGVSVSLARRRYDNGSKRLVSQTWASTDDRGDFRVFGVAPGDYEIVANFQTINLGSRDRMRYVPTYYPGTALASEAQRVTVVAAQEVTGITIALVRSATATLRGVVRSASDAPIGPFTLVTARDISGGLDAGISDGAAAPDGSFSIAGLLPGTYLLQAQSMMGGREFASKEVTVEGADVSGVTLTLSKGTAARGRITFDTGSPPADLSPSQIFVMAIADHEIGHDMSGGPPTVHDDWTFETRGLSGRGVIVAESFGDWHMKRARREGTDVTDTPLDFSADIDGLEIELTKQSTTVSGGVTDDHNDVVLDATVVVFPDEPAKWGPRSRFIGTARPDQKGRFTIKELPPGRYVAIAVEYLEPGEERDPDLLEKWKPRGTAFTLSEGESHALDLKLAAR